MTISSVGSTNPLLKQLETNGLSGTKASLVESDLAAAGGKSTAGGGTAGVTPAVRAAFETKIAADVLSGKLSASDAAAVKKTMDNLDGTAAASATAGQGASSAAGTSAAGGTASTGGRGGGGGGGSSSKTELSEAITISGSTMTTIITYTDGTTSTTTTTATDADKAKYDKHATNEATNTASGTYTRSLDKGSLVDQVA